MATPTTKAQSTRSAHSELEQTMAKALSASPSHSLSLLANKEHKRLRLHKAIDKCPRCALFHLSPSSLPLSRSLTVALTQITAWWFFTVIWFVCRRYSVIQSYFCFALHSPCKWNSLLSLSPSFFSIDSPVFCALPIHVSFCLRVFPLPSYSFCLVMLDIPFFTFLITLPLNYSSSSLFAAYSASGCDIFSSIRFLFLSHCVFRLSLITIRFQ